MEVVFTNALHHPYERERTKRRVVVLCLNEFEVFAHHQLAAAACGCVHSLDGRISMHSFVLKIRRAVEDAFTYVVAQQLLSKAFHGSGGFQNTRVRMGSDRVKRL